MNRFELVRIILDHLGIDAGRFSVKWISAAEGIRYVQLITEFDDHIRDIGPLGKKESLDPQVLKYKLRAAGMAVDGKMLRMVFAKQAKQMKDEASYGQLPSKEKVLETFKKEKDLYETLIYVKEKERSVSELSDLVGVPKEQVTSLIETLKKKSIWSGEVKDA